MLVGVLALLSTLSFPCFAEGTTTIHMSADSLSVGDTLSVTVTASESGSISLRYNADVLQFAGSSASYTTDGNTITFFNGVEGYNKKFHLEYTDPEMNIDGDLRFDVYQMY